MDPSNSHNEASSSRMTLDHGLLPTSLASSSYTPMMVSGSGTGTSSTPSRTNTSAGRTAGGEGTFDLPPMPVPYEDFQFSLNLPEEVSFSDLDLVRSPSFSELFASPRLQNSNTGSSSPQVGGPSVTATSQPMSISASMSSTSPMPPALAPHVPQGVPFGTAGKQLTHQPSGLQPPPPPDFEPPPGSSLFASFDDEQQHGGGGKDRDTMMDLGAGTGGDLHQHTFNPDGGGGGGGLGSGSGGGGDGLSNLFNAQESDFLTSFLEGFDWDFQPTLPEGMPLFPDAEQQQTTLASMSGGLEGYGSPPKAGGNGGGILTNNGNNGGGVAKASPRRHVSTSSGGANTGKIKKGAMAVVVGLAGASGGVGGGIINSNAGRRGSSGKSESPAGASDATSPRGSGTSETLTAGGNGDRGTPTSGDRVGTKMNGDLSTSSGSRKRRTTEQNRLLGANTGSSASLSTSAALAPAGHNQAQQQSIDGVAAAVAASGAMNPLLAQYPPHHPHAAIMQAAEKNNFSNFFPWLPHGSLTMQPASFAGSNLDQQQQQGTRTRTFDEMNSGDQHLAMQATGSQQQNYFAMQQQQTGNNGQGSEEPEKRNHHIFSEQRRRTNIREGFKELVELLELGRGFGARGLGLASGAGTGIEDEGLDDRSEDDGEEEEGSGLPRRKKTKARSRKSNSTRGKGKGRGRGGSAGGGAGSKSAVLFQAVDLLRWLQLRNQMIEGQCEKIESLLPPQSKYNPQM